MFGEGTEGHAMGRSQVADRAWSARETIQRVATRRVRQRAEDGIELTRLIMNHKVNCIDVLGRSSNGQLSLTEP